MAGLGDIDFGKQSADYAAHRPGFPDSFYERLQTFIGIDGARALDVGTGPGIIALELAQRGATVHGIDVSHEQIVAAQHSAESLGVADRCTFLVATAEDTGLPDAHFALATAGQCWHWFDKAAVMSELMRVVEPGGVVVVAHYCYLPRLDAVARQTEELILKHNPSWTMDDFDGNFPRHTDELIGGGFDFLEQFSYDHLRELSHAAWRGRIRTCNGVGSGILSPERVQAFDRELQSLLRDKHPDEPLKIRHRVWAVVVRRP